MHTGRPTTGTIVYPSIGSIVAHERPTSDGVPPYVVMGYPNVTRGPGFLARNPVTFISRRQKSAQAACAARRGSQTLARRGARRWRASFAIN